jgi:hypothetical protein
MASFETWLLLRRLLIDAAPADKEDFDAVTDEMERWETRNSRQECGLGIY